MTMFSFLLCMLALAYGSFVGSYVVRFPRMIDPESGVSIFSPRSRCESCKETLKVRMLIPLISFLLQKGKCSFCREPINAFYFLNESFHLLLIILILWSDIFLSWAEYLAIFLLLSCFYVQFLIDLKHLSLSIYMSAKILILGLILNFTDFFIDIQSAIIGAIVGYSSLYLINKIYFLIRKKDGIGGGDFILLASIGAIYGYQILSFVVLLGSLLSLLIFLIKRSDYIEKVPFGSGLSLSALIIMLIKISAM